MMKHSLALVTGASSGIGLSLCQLLASKGINLIITGRDLTKLNELSRSLETKVSVQVLQADLADSVERKRLVDIIQTRAPDLVINNAGFGLYNKAIEYPTAKQMEILQVNAVALLELTIEAAKAMKNHQKKGVIMNVSSAAAFYTFPYFSVYAASKSFVNQVSQSLDNELQEEGIRVLAVCPGMVDTNFRVRSGGTPVKEKYGLMTSSFVAEQIWNQIQNQKPLRIIDWKYRLTVFFSRLLPQCLIIPLLKNNIKQRTQ